MSAANEVQIVVKGENKAKPAVTDAKKDVKELGKAVGDLPDKKVIDIKADDKATAVVKKVDQEKVADKETKITADDQASKEIARISNTKPEPIRVPVKADSDFSGIDGKFKDIGKAGAGAFIGGFSGALAGGDLIGAVTGAFGDAIAQIGAKQSQAIDLANAMGISQDKAKEYGDRIGKLFWGGVGESKEQLQDTFSSLSSDVRNWGDLTAGQQDRIVTSAVGIAKAFKIDVSDGLKAASSMVDSKLVPSWDAAFDVITTGYQTLGSRADDILETLGEYSGYFQKLGITAPQALGLIQQGLKAGARDTDYIADAWKEFGILVIDGSQKTADALKGLGLNAKKIPEQIAAGGPAAEKAIETIIEKLKGIKSESDRNEIGLALFGGKWEDTMRNIISSVDPATAKIQDFTGATDKLVTSNLTAAEQMGRKWDEFTSKLGEDLSAATLTMGEFQESQNQALFGIGDSAEEQVAKFYNLGASIDGTNRGFQDLADTMGGYATAKFTEMVGHMSNTQLAAYGVTRSVNEVGQTVLTLPNGKQIVIDTNSGKVVSDLSGVRQAVNNLPTSKFFTYFMDTVVRSAPPSNMAPMPFRAAGGPVGAASGGARGSLTRVNERGLELGRSPNGTIRDLETGTTVIPAGQSAAIMSGQGPVGGGGAVRVELVWDMSGLSGLERVFAQLVQSSVRKSGKNGDLQRWAE